MSRHKSLTPEQACEVVRLSSYGSTDLALAEKFGVGPKLVRDIRRGYAYAEETGLPPIQLKTGRPRRLSNEQVAGIVGRFGQGIPRSQIAREFGVVRSLVDRVLSGRGYSDVTGLDYGHHRSVETTTAARNMSRIRALIATVECSCGTKMRKHAGPVWDSSGVIYCEQCQERRE